jgi:hypothetical protein
MLCLLAMIDNLQGSLGWVRRPRQAAKHKATSSPAIFTSSSDTILRLLVSSMNNCAIQLLEAKEILGTTMPYSNTTLGPEPQKFIEQFNNVSVQ